MERIFKVREDVSVDFNVRHNGVELLRFILVKNTPTASRHLTSFVR